MRRLKLDGHNLTLSDLAELIADRDLKCALAPTALKLMKKSQAFLQRAMAKEKIVYGANTGFGPMAAHFIETAQADALQRNLILGHAVGLGEPLSEDYVLAAMVVRLNALLKGYSAVSAGLVQSLLNLINYRIVPVVPEHGAVGTSGDLVQLAHIALALIGEGDVFYHGEKLPVKTVFKRLGLRAYRLKTREGLALINGTSVMSGIAALLTLEAKRLLNLAISLGAWSLELAGAFDDSLAIPLQTLRPHSGQIAVARKLRLILASSRRLRNRDFLQKIFSVNGAAKQINNEVQQVYSLRCLPQIIGPVFDIWTKVKKEVDIEINAVTDNPVIDAAGGRIWHGGNFHGDYIAAAMDQLKAAVVKLTILSERRTNYFLHAKINQHFPPFMNLGQPGLTMGLQGLQLVATSTVAQSQSYAYPHHLHSISTNGDNQDVVSMGTDAALLTAKVIANAYVVMTVELAVLMQGLRWVISAKSQTSAGNLKDFSRSTRRLFAAADKIFPVLIEDRILINELSRLVCFVKQRQNNKEAI